MKNQYNNHIPYSNYLNYSKSNESSKKRKRLQNLWSSIEYTNKPAINDKSKRIAQSKKTTNISVHERLHQQAISKQKIEKRQAQNNSLSLENRFDISDLQSTELKKGRRKRNNKSMNVGNRAPLNYGSRLYQKGIKKLEEAERKHQEAILKKEENEIKDLTFHPKINPVSYYFGSSEQERPEDYLLRQGMLTKDKLEQK